MRHLKQSTREGQKALVESYLAERYGKPLELFWSEDHIESPRWVARYPSGMSYNVWGASMTPNFKECEVRFGKVEEL